MQAVSMSERRQQQAETEECHRGCRRRFRAARTSLAVPATDSRTSDHSATFHPAGRVIRKAYNATTVNTMNAESPMAQSVTE